MVAAGEVERFPVVAAKSEVGRRRCAVDDAAELPAVRVDDPDAAGAAAIDVALDIDLHPVGDAGFAAAQIGEDAVGVPGQHAARQQLEGADVAAPRVIDIEDFFFRREGEPVGQDKIVDQQAQRPEIGGDAIDPGKGEVPLVGRGRPRPRVGEIDAAVGFDDDVVGSVERVALKAVGNDGDASVMLQAGDSPAIVFAGDEAALEVTRQPVSAVGRLADERYALARLVFHAPVVVDVAEQQVAALGPP